MIESCLLLPGRLVIMTGFLSALAVGVTLAFTWWLAPAGDALDLVDLSAYELLPTQPRRATPPPTATYWQAKLPF